MPKTKTRKPRPPRSARSRGSARYASREEQMAEVLEHVRRRDRKVYDALLTILTRGDGRVLAALGVLLEFVVAEATARTRRTR